MNIFKDKLAVITGASSGIGRAIALAFAKEGAACCLVSRNKERLEEVAKVARKNSPLVQTYALDLQVDKNIQFLYTQLKKKNDSIDVLVHSAGLFISNPFQNAAIEDLDTQFAINVRTPYLLTQSLLPLLRSAKGQVVFINSSQAINASGRLSQYASTKHSLKAIADSLREEVNQDGIRVLSLFLGRTATPIMEAIYKKEGRQYDPSVLLQPSDVASVITHTLALPRTAEVTNISIRPMIKS
jgi:NADP-dependent 3-hydroxy acid dehydrogenase YdfG